MTSHISRMTHIKAVKIIIVKKSVFYHSNNSTNTIFINIIDTSIYGTVKSQVLKIATKRDILHTRCYFLFL